MRVERILVTGGAGFIGSHLVDALVGNGREVIVFDDLSSGSLANIGCHSRDKEFIFVKGDVVDKQLLRESLRDVDAVYHLAAIVSVPYSISNPESTIRVNVEGTRNLLEACADIGVKRFINVSSCAVYGEPRYLPTDENHPLNPMSPYAESKLRGEEYCREFREKRGLETVTLRLFNAYGARQRYNEYSGVITKFISDIRAGRPPTIFGDGEQTRDFVNAGDVVEALLLSLDKSSALGQTFNIGSGRPITIGNLCQLVLSKLGAKTRPVYMEPRLGDIKHSWAKIDKAHQLLGYEPQVSIERGLDSLTKPH